LLPLPCPTAFPPPCPMGSLLARMRYTERCHKNRRAHHKGRTSGRRERTDRQEWITGMNERNGRPWITGMNERNGRMKCGNEKGEHKG
jgi:hypothetical protein